MIPKNRDKLWQQARLTLIVVAILSLNVIGWILGAATYEIWTLKNDRPNDTISHSVLLLTDMFPWLPVACWGFLIVNVLFWIIVFCHWFVKGFWWKKAVIVDDSEDEK